MISLNWDSMDGQIGELMKAYDKLPRHIAKKHLKAAIKRTLKDGVPLLKAETPKGGKRRVTAAVSRNAKGQFLPGSGKKSIKRGGDLRRAVTSQAKYIGTNKSGMVVGSVGYKYGFQSKKALWLVEGTKYINPRAIMESFMRRYGGPASSKLAQEMADALEKAARDLAPGEAQGYRRV